MEKLCDSTYDGPKIRLVIEEHKRSGAHGCPSLSGVLEGERHIECGLIGEDTGCTTHQNRAKAAPIADTAGQVEQLA